MLARIKLLGCRAIHIGGGEPLLSPDTVEQTLRLTDHAGVRVEYVETNSSWFKGMESTVAVLETLQGAGLETLLVSISPFHNAHIPFKRVQGVLAACEQTGIRAMPWISGFIPDLAALDPECPHSLGEYVAHFGKTYLTEVMQRYWLHPGGRALDLYRAVGPLKPVTKILEGASVGCYRELADIAHFHVDLYGNYIPGLCAGLVIDFMDIGRTLSTEKYPLIALLAGDGIQGLYAHACRQHAFAPATSGYANKCDLCNDIRQHIFGQDPESYRELGPAGYYQKQ